jgi:hypothetical protein
MACVFLEHITWFLLGNSAVERFATERVTPDVRFEPFTSDIYFTLNDDRRGAKIKKQVHDWINDLRANPGCCEYLHSLLGIIEDRMLQSDPRLRITASELHGELVKLERCVRLSPSFYMKHWTECKHSFTPTDLSPRQLTTVSGRTLRVSSTDYSDRY